MKLNAPSLLQNLCDDRDIRRAQQLARELTRLLEERHVEVTPLVLPRLEEFLLLYHVVQGIEDTLRREGLFDVHSEVKKSARAAEDTVSANAASVAGAQRRLHPNVELAVKYRDRLNKTIKDLEAILAAGSNEKPLSLAELLSPLGDSSAQEKADACAA